MGSRDTTPHKAVKEQIRAVLAIAEKRKDVLRQLGKE